MKAATLAAALRIFATELERLEEAERDERRDWIDQTASPLGRKRHCAAVRRLLAAGDSGAANVGRRHLLSTSTLAAELARASGTKPAKSKPRSNAVVTPVLSMTDRLEQVKRSAAK